MKCRNCGGEIHDGEKYCHHCGTKQNRKVCINCGTEIGKDDLVCNRCGKPVQDADISYDEMKKQINSAREKEKKTVIICAAVVGAAIIFTGCMIIGFSSMGGGKIPEAAVTPYVTLIPSPSPTPLPTPTPSPTPSPTPEQVVSNDYNDKNNTYNSGILSSGRRDLYNSSLTYKRMDDIHSSVLADDYTYYDVSTVIENFDYQCAAYVNGSRALVPDQLVPGSNAFNQQVSYKEKHPSLKQSYLDVEVINCRESSKYCYAWVREVIEQTENGSVKTQTDHWVYKLVRRNGDWYIDDYTRDPAY